MDGISGRNLIEIVTVASLSGVFIAQGLPVAEEVQSNSSTQMIEFQRSAIHHSLETLKASMALAPSKIESCRDLWNATIVLPQGPKSDKWTQSETPTNCTITFNLEETLTISAAKSDYFSVSGKTETVLSSKLSKTSIAI